MIIIKAIDGHTLAQMMISGANHLYNNRHIVNDLNVFPVPDGDTGTNMSMTISAMAKALQETQSTSVSKTADTMAYATLRGARGNSGVILSQFFRGISKSLKGIGSCTPLEFANALNEGVDTAYRAVMNPTEGTILTVSREAAMSAVVEANKEADLAAVLDSAVTRGNRALAKTQDMLPALKQAGVVDAGGQGWMFVLEGMLSYLKTGVITERSDSSDDMANKPDSTRTSSDIHENIHYMYCTEFIIQKKSPHVNIDVFREAISGKGDCMLVIDDEEIVKVHIHTNHPGFVLERAVKLGEMINIKIDNMKYQHQNLLEENKKEKPTKPYGFVAVCVGEGLKNICKDFGIDQIIEGGQTMNPSTEDILQAVNQVYADTIFIFPNNKNILLAANQAKDISDRHIIVIPTSYITECFAAMMSFSDKQTPEQNEAQMCQSIKNIRTGQVTYAVRDSSADGKEIHEGDYLGMIGKSIVAIDQDYTNACLSLIEHIADDDSEFITVYYGDSVAKDTAEALTTVLEETYEDAEISLQYGGQSLYYYIISVE